MHTEPKQAKKNDQDKMPWHYVPHEFFEWIADIMQFGAKKYNWNNWQGLEPDRMSDAAMRHLLHHIKGRQEGTTVPKDNDEDQEGSSPFPSLAHVAVSALMSLWLCKKENHENEIDRIKETLHNQLHQDFQRSAVQLDRERDSNTGVFRLDPPSFTSTQLEHQRILSRLKEESSGGVGDKEL